MLSTNFSGGSIPLNRLNVIGYATVLNENMLPSVVPPVFRDTDNLMHVYFPPFCMHDGVLYGATESPYEEAASLETYGEITLFPEGKSYLARPGHELWLDFLRKPHYEPQYIADGKLTKINRGYVEKAVRALAARDLERAERFSSAAVSADDRLVEPFANKVGEN